MIRMTMKRRIPITLVGEAFRSMKGTAIRRAISMSNTRKTTARRKNRSENGSRAEFIGEIPHSKGEDFSRSMLYFALMKKEMLNRASARRVATRAVKRVSSICNFNG